MNDPNPIKTETIFAVRMDYSDGRIRLPTYIAAKDYEAAEETYRAYRGSILPWVKLSITKVDLISMKEETDKLPDNSWTGDPKLKCKP